MLLGRVFSGTISRLISVMVETSWNSVIGLLDWFRYLLISIVTEGKKTVIDEAVLCLSVVKEIVSVVLLIILVMVIL